MPTRTRTRAVLFDAGNTLVFVQPERALDILTPFGVAAPRDAFEAAERAARLRLTGLLSQTEPPPEAEAWRAYFGTLMVGLGIPLERAEEAGAAMFAEHERDHMWTRTDPETSAALERLLDDGYRLGVVSNADGRMPALIERVGLAGYFEFVVDSHLVGVAKPDARIFHEALDRLAKGGDEPRADECLYVGDLYAVDVVGARRAGLRPLLLEPFGQYEGLDLGVECIAEVAELPQWLGGRAATP